MIRVEEIRVEVPGFSLEVEELEVGDGEYLVIMGPSGSGKTMLLETIAGLREQSSGRIYVGGKDVSKLPPESRGLSYLPQSIALWPHMTVFENIAFGLRVRGMNSEEVKRRVIEISKVMGIEELLSRRPAGLSGGERQRVALARALVVSPKAILLDEPLSSLDVATAEKLKAFIKELRGKVGFTAIHVTHNPLEAAELADRIAVLYKGRLFTQGPASKVMRDPNALEIFAQSKPVILEGLVRRASEGLIEVHVSGHPILAVGDGCVPGSRAIITVRPEDVAVFRALPKGGSARNILKCKLLDHEEKGPLVELILDAGGNTVRAMVTRGSFEQLDMKKGERVYAVFKASATRLLRCYR